MYTKRRLAYIVVKLFLVIFVFFYSIPLDGKEIAISFDDVPIGDKLKYSGVERTSLIIDKLKRLNVTAIFFANTFNINDEGISRIKSYSDAGHMIGNHNHYHKSIAQLGVLKYKEGIYKADEILKQYPTFKKFYRYPYLNEGETEFEQTYIRKTLKDFGYKNGYVTVDNFEWYIESMFQYALRENKFIDYDKLRSAYIDIIYECIEFYDDIAMKVLGKSPKHILLLHENDLAAMYIDSLTLHLKKKGWKIISPIEAYDDPISHKDVDESFTNQGRIASIASKEGIDETKLRHWSENEDNLQRYFEERGIFLEVKVNSNHIH